MRIEGSLNHIPGIAVDSYPTLLFYKGKSKPGYVEYKGSKDLSAIKKWIKIQAS
jgi:hypothetical protein